MKTKRIFAYLIDMLLIIMVSTFIFRVAFQNTAYNEYQEKTEYYVKRIINSGSSDIEEDELITMAYEINRSQIPLQIIEFGITILYFGIISFIANGQTLGKKIMKIRVVPIKGKKLNPALYFLREVILTNSIFNLLSIINISLCSESRWYLFNSIITNGKTIVIVLLVGVLIFREDERSLHDIICKTNVIDEKKEK